MKFKHPYWKELHYQLTKRGYELDYADTEEKIYQWKKTIFDQTNQFITLLDAYSNEYDTAVCCDLGLTSPYLVETFNRIRLPECYEQDISLMANVNSDYEYIDIISVALHWLCLNAKQPLKQLDWPMSKNNAVQDVQLLLKHIDTYWPRMLNEVNTEKKLITFLNDIDSYPKKTPAKGPISGDPNVYSAFYSLKIGDIKGAQERIEIAYEQQIKRDEALIFDDKEALANCKAQQDRIYAKYREEINRHV